MSELYSSTEFWFGAFILMAYQVSKFNELNSLAPELTSYSAAIPNVRAKDFAGRRVFYAALTVFLAVTLLGYILLCAASPKLLIGWAKVSGMQGDLESFVHSVPYPLYIVAAFIGVTQPFPGIPNIGNIQRNIFHAWIGVPKKVVDTSGFLSNEIIAKNATAADLAAVVKRLASDVWIGQIDEYADTIFYRHQLERLKATEEERDESTPPSKRELKRLVAQLVYAAALAVVRESGGKALRRLADDLGVSFPPPPASIRDYMAGFVLCLLAMTLLWLVIPMFDQTADAYLRGGLDFWPSDLNGSGQYLFSQAVPIFVCTVVALSMWLRIRQHAEASATRRRIFTGTFIRHVEKYDVIILSVILVVVGFDLLQALYDFGQFNVETRGSLLQFVLGNLPFYILHSFISVATCFIILIYVERTGGRAAGSEMLWYLGLVVVGVGSVSGFYAATRLYYQFPGQSGLDFATLMVAINVSAALLSFATSLIFVRRHIDGGRSVALPAAGPAGGATGELAV
ncbi:MAG TPA: hypothetical protein VHG30_14570 [Microvirga sp.]|nr:hypothetical protein [Microvirga sp.]